MELTGKKPLSDEEARLRARVAAAIAAGGGIKSLIRKTGIPKGTLEKYAAQSSTASFVNAARIATAAGVTLDQIAYSQEDISKNGAKERLRGIVDRMPSWTETRRELDVDRLELAITTVERGLDEADRVAAPDVKAGMVSAAYEILTEPTEAAVGRILRLVKG